MRVIRVTVDRRNEGVRVAVAMSPSLLAEVVENGGDVRFNSISDNDLALELNAHIYSVSRLSRIVNRTYRFEEFILVDHYAH